MLAPVCELLCMLSYRSSCRKLGIGICAHAHGIDDIAALQANMLLTFTRRL